MKTQDTSAQKLLYIIEEKDKRIAELKQQLDFLMDQFKLLKHKRFGASSEETSEDQISIFNEAEASSDLTTPEPELTKVKEHYRKRTRLTTDKLPKDLPVEVIEHILPEEKRICPDCGGMLHEMGKETREELKIIPAKAVITRYVRYVYSYRNCESASDHVPIVKADMLRTCHKGLFCIP